MSSGRGAKIWVEKKATTFQPHENNHFYLSITTLPVYCYTSFCDFVSILLPSPWSQHLLSPVPSTSSSFIRTLKDQPGAQIHSYRLSISPLFDLRLTQLLFYHNCIYITQLRSPFVPSSPATLPLVCFPFLD